MSLESLTDKIAKAIIDKFKRDTYGQDKIAEVKKVDGKTAWVHLDGGVDLTPVENGIGCKKGDKVRVRMVNGSAFLQNNITHPPTDDTKANEANGKALSALKRIDELETNTAEKIQENVTQFALEILRINDDIDNLQDQLDGNITQWTYNYDPTLTNYPASEWIAQHTESEHIGDVFYNSANGYAWRWMRGEDDTYSWVKISDSAVIEALAKATQAYDLADGKRRIFITQPIPPYDAGDLWVQGSTGDVLVCTYPDGRTSSEVYVASDWTKASKYTDDTRANEAYDRASAALTSANGKNTVYRGTSESVPPGGTYAIGDVWFDTGNDNKINRWDGTRWVAFTLGDDALDGISANKITAGTIDASQITVSNIDAGNITSGYISADRINTGTISINKLTNDAKSSIITGTTVVTQYYLSTSSSSATDGSWQNTVPTWSSGKYIWTREATSKTYASGTAQTTYQPSQNGRYDVALTTALSTGNTAASVAGNANYREQTIYKSAANGTTSMSGTTTWITSSSNAQNAWTTRRPTYSTSYPVLFVATQRQTMGNSSGNTCTCTTPVIDETTTVIDGGRIIANSVTADQINVNTLQLGETQITNLTTHLNAKADTSSVPTKVSQLTNDSSFATTGQVSTAASNAQSAAISTAATDATTKANAAAKTASDFIGVDTSGIKIAKNVASATTYTWVDSTSFQVYKGGASITSVSDAIRLGKLSAENLYFTSANNEGTLAFRNGTSTTCAIIGDSDSGMMTLQTGNGANQVVMTTGSVDYATFNNGSAELNGTLSVAKKLTAGAINNSLFAVTSETFEYSTKYGAGNQEKTTSAVTKSGYYPLGVVGFSANQTGWVVRRCYLTDKGSGTCKVYFNIKNTTSTQYAITFTAHILWVKITA